MANSVFNSPIIAPRKVCGFTGPAGPAPGPFGGPPGGPGGPGEIPGPFCGPPGGGGGPEAAGTPPAAVGAIALVFKVFISFVNPFNLVC
ncbi:MAG TPA: hypothetical protein VGB37_06985, partial [Candidatus Lokiarchaeia archaeon]